MSTISIESEMYQGMSTPTVEFGMMEAAGGDIIVSLDCLDEEVHNQSYGMMRPSTGCINTPGGPPC